MKRRSHHMLSENREVKQEDTATGTGTTKIQQTNSSKCWGGRGATATLTYCQKECQMVQPLWHSLAVAYNTQRKFTLRFSSCTLRCLPQWMENLGSHKNLHKMFYISLFIISPNWKPPRCPSVGDCINKPWCNHKMEYVSVSKWNELSSMKRVGGTLNSYAWLKEDILKRLHSVRLQLYYILEKAKLGRW